MNRKAGNLTVCDSVVLKHGAEDFSEEIWKYLSRFQVRP